MKIEFEYLMLFMIVFIICVYAHFFGCRTHQALIDGVVRWTC